MITFPNNKVYIGQCNVLDRNGNRRGSRLRLSNHITESRTRDSKIANAFKRFGDDVKLEVLMEVNTELAGMYEDKFINLYNSRDDNFGYNTQRGAKTVSRSKEETCKKQSETRQINPGFAGKSHTKKTTSKISTALLETKRFGHRGQELPMYLGLRNAKDRCGYRISEYHPLIGDCNQHSFVTTEYNNSSIKDERYYRIMDEKYNLCLEELNRLNRMI